MKQIAFTTELRWKDYQRAYLLTVLYNKFWLSILFYFVLLIGFLSIFTFHYFIPSLSIVSLWTIISLVGNYNFFRKKVLGDSNSFKKVSWTIDDTSILWSTTGTTGNFKLIALKEVQESDDWFYLWTGKNSYLLIPKYQLSQEIKDSLSSIFKTFSNFKKLPL
jgi:hypothetical protein